MKYQRIISIISSSIVLSIYVASIFMMFNIKKLDVLFQAHIFRLSTVYFTVMTFVFSAIFLIDYIVKWYRIIRVKNGKFERGEIE